MHTLPAGTSMGPYDLGRVIGSGGMGVVYEAQHRALGRRVAVKVCHPRSDSAGNREIASARFLREGRAAAQVRHPNIVDVFDFGVQDGLEYLAMELVDGETLAQLLVREAPLPLTRVAELLLPIIVAVAELHAAGVIHRDLKPANILLARERGVVSPKVADFGLSRLDDGSARLTASDAIVGTYAYMSPEQARASKGATERSDQYALGVMLYECATGCRPFVGGAPYELLHAIVHDEVLPPSTKNDALPHTFDALVLRAIARDPAARFVSVDELGEALLQFATPAVAAQWTGELTAPRSQSGTTPVVASPTASRSTSRERRSVWWPVILGALGVGALIGVAAARAGGGAAARVDATGVSTAAAASLPSVAVVASGAVASVSLGTPVDAGAAAPSASASIVAAPAASSSQHAASSLSVLAASSVRHAPPGHATSRSTTTGVDDNGAPIIEP